MTDSEVVDTVFKTIRDTVFLASAPPPSPVPTDDVHRAASSWSGPVVSVFQTLLSGALGALFASWDARARRHHSALVHLERRFNQDLNKLSDNRRHVAGILASMEKGAVHWSWPTAIEIDTAAYDDLVNRDLINVLMGFNTFVAKVNHDANNLHAGYSQMTSALLTSAITLENFQMEARRNTENVRILGNAYAHIEDESKRLLSCVRIMLRTDLPISGRIVLLLVRTKMPTKHAVDKELVKLEAEIATTRVASTEEIKRVVGSGSDATRPT